MQTIEQLKAGKLSGTIHVKLREDQRDFPLEILELADTLEILDLSGNRLNKLPDEFVRLKKLRILFLSDNEFTEFPSVLAVCTQLDMIGFKANKIEHIAEDALPINVRWLILTNNRLICLPKSIGKCTKLQKVMLAGNQLKELPDEMVACKRIELLRISANDIQEFPLWLFSLPRLSWLAYAGNPCSKVTYSPEYLQEISWNELTLIELLGEGASGVISKADMRDNTQEVAVKVFKGEVTSDGRPDDEMNACIAAGVHPNLVCLLGKIIDHPKQKQGLVFTLIPSTFKILGGSPDFKTCTRDTFNEGTLFPIHHIARVAGAIASAMVHLHARGIMHGDLYAHNILVDEMANSLLSDYGAATWYDRRDAERGKLLERIEVRAFGCLLDDMLSHIDPKDEHHPITKTLINLRQECFDESIMQRPDFIRIEKIIKT